MALLHVRVLNITRFWFWLYLGLMLLLLVLLLHLMKWSFVGLLWLVVLCSCLIKSMNTCKGFVNLAFVASRRH